MTVDRHTELWEALAAQGRRPDSEMDLAESALLLAALDHPDGDLSQFRNHLAELTFDEELARIRELYDPTPSNAPEPDWERWKTIRCTPR